MVSACGGYTQLAKMQQTQLVSNDAIIVFI